MNIELELEVGEYNQGSRECLHYTVACPLPLPFGSIGKHLATVVCTCAMDAGVTSPLPSLLWCQSVSGFCYFHDLY